MRLTATGASFRFVALLALVVGGTSASFAQAGPHSQTFALSDTKVLTLVNVKADAAEYEGRKAVRLTKDTDKDGFAFLPGTDFQDGTIEADIALKITTPPGVRMPGFVGIAFRARPDASRYELFYLRPGNALCDDQAMRNHSGSTPRSPSSIGSDCAASGLSFTKATQT